MKEFGAFMKQRHKERVLKNPERIAFAIHLLSTNGVKFSLVNEVTGQINVKTENGTETFYCGTGKIKGQTKRGIRNFLELVRG